MREYELRFRVEENKESSLKEKMATLGFTFNKKYSMSDIIFEPKDWVPGTVRFEGYYIIRIRMMEGRKPVLQLKEYLKEDTWEETELQVDDVHSMLRLLMKGFTFSKIISKNREEHVQGKSLITIDDVLHLGKFIEIEADKQEVLRIAKELDFNLAEKEKDYGYQIYIMEKEGKLSFSEASIDEEIGKLL